MVWYHAREGAKTMATNLMASGKQFIKQAKKFAISELG